MLIPARRARRRALKLVVVVAAGLAALLSLAAPAFASFKAHVQAGTLQIVGDAASDKLALRLAPGNTGVLEVDVGEDGTTDFSFDRSTFTAIDVQGGGGNDQLRVDGSGGSL